MSRTEKTAYLIVDITDSFELPAFLAITRQEAAAFLGTSANVFSSMVSKRRTFGKRYKVERVRV